MLNTNKTLKKLDLGKIRNELIIDGNYLGDKGLEELLKGLEKNKTLEFLDLSNKNNSTIFR